MASVIKRTHKLRSGGNNTSWGFTFYDKSGERIRRSGFKTKIEAENELAELQTQLNSVNYIKEDTQITFEEMAKNYMEFHVDLYCKPSTKTNFEQYFRTHLQPFFGKKKLIDINPQLITKFIAKKIKEGNLSNKSINNYVSLLHSILQKAVDEEIIIKNPVSKVKKLKVVQKEVRFLTEEEINAVLNVAQKYYPDFYPLLLTAIMTGMRRGEILGLTWDRLNFRTNKIMVRHNLYKGKLTTPKTLKSIRNIDMPETLVKVLKEWKLKAPPSDYVFANKIGLPRNPENMIKRKFFPVVRKAGIDKIRFHDLRHTYASILIAKNVPIKYIQAQMGHSAIDVTLNTYGHLLPEVHQKGIEALESIFGKKNDYNNQEKHLICGQ